MKTLIFKDKVAYALFVLAFIAIILFTIDGYRLYGVSSDGLIPYSIRKITKDNGNRDFIDQSYLVEDKSINNSRILVFKIDENYDILIYTKSIIYNRYSFYESLYDVNQNYIIAKDGVYLGVKDPMYSYSIGFSINEEDKSIIISNSPPKSNIKEIIFSVSTYVIVVVSIYLFRESKDKS